jgi:hypothetical protein
MNTPENGNALRVGSSDLVACGSTILAGMMANKWWIDFAVDKATKGGNGSVQEIMCEVALKYARELRKQATDKLTDAGGETRKDSR